MRKFAFLTLTLILGLTFASRETYTSASDRNAMPSTQALPLVRDDVWVKLLGTSERESGHGLALDSSGNSYIAGSTQRNLDGNTNAGDDDLFVWKNGERIAKAMPYILPLLLDEDEDEPNIAFVTSEAFNGDLGGLAGADRLCQDLAEGAGLPTNTYVAWLSTPSVNAIDRLGGARGWIRVDGKPLADTLADISDGRMFHPLRVDEFGNFDDTSEGYVWTGTINWAGNGESCSNWTSSARGDYGVYGTSDGMSYVFKRFGSLSCRGLARLYCLGVDNNARVKVVPAVGRMAFITRGSWASGGGVAAADQLCQDEAMQAGLNGTFKALLATDGASAASRFNLDGSPWVRPDGVVIAQTGAELFTSEYIDSAIHQSADGLVYYANYGVWTGAIDPTTAGTSNTTCKNWTDSGNNNTAISGRAGFTAQWKFFAFDSDTPCSSDYVHLYCLQN